MAEPARQRARSKAFYGGVRPDLGDFIWDLPISNSPEDSGPKRRPPPATPVTLPVYTVGPYSSNEATNVNSQRLNDLFVQTYLGKWTAEQHRCLRVRLANNTYIEDLVPTSYIPPRTWEEKPTPGQNEQRNTDNSPLSSETLSNGASIPGHEAFYVRVNELKCDREDAMNALTRRKPSAGKPTLRLSHYRRFWLVVDTISCYWDTSKDKFRPQGAPEPLEAGKSRPALQPSAIPANNDTTTQLSVQPRTGTTAQSTNLPKIATGTAVDSAVRSLDIGSTNTSATKPGSSMHLPEIKDYYGLRTSDGRSMDNNHRRELVYTFIEPIIQAMGCHYDPNRGPFIPQASRAVRIGNSLIRQDITGLVHRGPKDRALARQGWKEGPILVVSARSGLNFTQPVSIKEAQQNETWTKMLRASNVDLLAQLQNPATKEAAKVHLHELGFHVLDGKQPQILRWTNFDIIDSSQEIGALLMLAQQRDRNAKSEEEVRVGSGQWWADAPRYGGHENMGEEVGKPLFKDDLTPVSDEPEDEMAVDEEYDKEELPAPRGPIDPEAAMIAVSPSRIHAEERQHRGSGRASNKQSKEIKQFRARRDLRWQPPKPIWDSRTNFLPVGKGPEQDFDHVYLVSSLFHHISILRLRVHPAMLKFLASTDPDAPKPPPEQYGLWIARTRWFDLLKTEDRVDAARGIWGVMAYMMRDTETFRPEDMAFASRLIRNGV